MSMTRWPALNLAFTQPHCRMPSQLPEIFEPQACLSPESPGSLAMGSGYVAEPLLSTSAAAIFSFRHQPRFHRAPT